MATPKEILRINGREVAITNPHKVFFPATGHTKLDLVRYYLAVADGALRGAGGRPMALKRFVDGAAGEPFFQKRAPDNRPEWIRTAELTFPSGRTADEIVIDDAAGLAWVVNLGCIDLNPHPVRADDLDHPDELRVDLDPVPGRRPGRRSARWRWPRERPSRRSGSSAGRRRPARAGIHINVRIERRWTYPEVRRAALALARDVERRAPGVATSKWWKEERHGVFLDYNQNAKDRTVASAYSVRPLPDARVSTPLVWDEVPDRRGRGVHDRHRARRASPRSAIPARDRRRGRVARGAAGAVARDEAEGLGDAPWPPNYAKQAGEPPRVQPSRQRRADDRLRPGRGEAGRTAARGRRGARRRPSPPATRTPACRPSGPARARRRPAGARPRSRSSRSPARSTKAEALEGLERWKARHPDVAAAPRAGGRPRRRHARPLVALVPGPGQPHPRAGGRPAGPGAARDPTTTRGPATTSRPEAATADRSAPASRPPKAKTDARARRARHRPPASPEVDRSSWR